MGREIISGEYCGTLGPLVGERAILLNTDRQSLMEDDGRLLVLAQFDNRELMLDEIYMGYHWHQLQRRSFTNFYFLTI